MTFLEKCIPASVCAAIEVLMFTCPFSTRVCLLALTRALGCAFTDNGILWMLIFGGKEYFQPLSYSVININHIYLQIDIINIYSKTLHWIREWWCGCNLFFLHSATKEVYECQRKKKKIVPLRSKHWCPRIGNPKTYAGYHTKRPELVVLIHWLIWIMKDYIYLLEITATRYLQGFKTVFSLPCWLFETLDSLVLWMHTHHLTTLCSVVVERRLFCIWLFVRFARVESDMHA